MHANDHRGFYPLGGVIDVMGSSVPDNPSRLGDGSMQRYDYYNNVSYSGVPPVLTGLPGALSPYLTGTAASSAIFGYAAEDDFVNAEPLRESFMCPSDETIVANMNAADAALAANPLATPYYSSGAPKWIYCSFGGTYVQGYSSYAF